MMPSAARPRPVSQLIWLACLAVSLVLCETAWSAIEAPALDAHSALWGRTSGEVRKQLGTAPEEGYEGSLTEGPREYVFYRSGLGATKALAVYIFEQDRLIRVKYLFESRKRDPQQFMDLYESIRVRLDQVSGSTGIKKSLWRNNLYRDFPDDHAMALAVGHLYLSTKWKTGKSRLLLYAGGNDFKIDVELEVSPQE